MARSRWRWRTDGYGYQRLEDDFGHVAARRSSSDARPLDQFGRPVSPDPPDEDDDEGTD